MEILLLAPVILLMVAFPLFIATAAKPASTPVTAGLWKELTVKDRTQGLTQQRTDGASPSRIDRQELTQELADLRSRVDVLFSRLNELADADGGGADQKAA